MVNYYRYSNKKTPMSNWGHAMFVCEERFERVCNGYGSQGYLYNGQDGVQIEDLFERISKEWNENDIYRPADFEHMDAEEVYEMFNPLDIVDTAGAWDDGSLTQWIYERVLEPIQIRAVITEDGAIVFDEELISRLEGEFYYDGTSVKRLEE